ncbi:phage tail sheath subtilisin-like domain-containing protein [Salmonella enterica subsp. enterica serovar Bareilly]
MSVFFNGQLLVTPTTASAVDDSAMLNQNLSVGNVVAYIGQADAGEPQTVLSFGSPNEALKVLKSGELCDAVTSAFAPSSETGSPQTVLAVRVNKMGQASVALQNASKLTPGVFGYVKGKSFTSSDQQISVKVENGSKAGQCTITISGGTSVQPWTLTGQDLGGTTITVTNTAQHSTVGFFTDAQGEPYGEFRLDIDPTNSAHYTPVRFYLANFATLGDMTDYMATIKDASGTAFLSFQYANLADRELPPTALDPRSIPGATSAGPVVGELTTFVHSVQTWFKQVASDYVVLEMEPANKGGWHSGIEPMPATYLQAPVPGPVTYEDWEKCLAMLEYRDVQWVQVVTGNPAIHAQVKSHVTVSSNVNRRERRSICGTPVDTKDADAVKLAKDINSDRVSLVNIGHYAYDRNGRLALRPAYMTAGLVAAAFAGSNPGTPLTNKTLAVQGLERDLRNPTDTDILIKGGVMPIENTETGYKVTQSISTWLADSKYNKREQSCGVAVDFTIRNVRNAVDVLRGQKQSPLLLSRAVSITKGTLSELARPEPQGPAVLVGDEKSPAYRNVTATVEGDVLRIQFEASPAIPNNYILVTMYAVPYSGSATA